MKRNSEFLQGILAAVHLEATTGRFYSYCSLRVSIRRCVPEQLWEGSRPGCPEATRELPVGKGFGSTSSGRAASECCPRLCSWPLPEPAAAPSHRGVGLRGQRLRSGPWRCAGASPHRAALRCCSPAVGLWSCCSAGPYS